MGVPTCQQPTQYRTIHGYRRAFVHVGQGPALLHAVRVPVPERCERLVLVSSGGVSRAVHPMLRLLTAPASEHALACLQLPGMRASGTVFFRMLRLLGKDLGRDGSEMMSMFDALRDGFSRKAFLRTLRAVVDLQGQVVTMLDRCYLTQGMPCSDPARFNAVLRRPSSRRRIAAVPDRSRRVRPRRSIRQGRRPSLDAVLDR